MPTQRALALAALTYRQTTRVEASLASEQPPGRYAFHDLLRTYAAELTEDESPEERDAASRRAIAFYVAQAHQATMLTIPMVARYFKAPDPPPEGVAISQFTRSADGVAWFRAEQNVLPRVLAWAHDCGLDIEVVQLRSYMEPYIARLDSNPAANETMMAAATRLGDHAAIAAGLFGIGRGAMATASYEVAADTYKQALEHALLSEDLNWQAMSHMALASAADGLGNANEAASHARRAVDAARKAGMRESTSSASSASAKYELATSKTGSCTVARR